MRIEERVAELEARLAFQDDAVETLNREVIGLRGELAALRETVALLRERLRGLEPAAVGDAADEPPPPHY